MRERVRLGTVRECLDELYVVYDDGNGDQCLRICVYDDARGVDDRAGCDDEYRDSGGSDEFLSWGGTVECSV